MQTAPYPEGTTVTRESNGVTLYWPCRSDFDEEQGEKGGSAKSTLVFFFLRFCLDSGTRMAILLDMDDGDSPRPQETEAMTTTTHLKVTFEMTPEYAAEANARAGGMGAGEEIQEMIDCSRCKFRVRTAAVAVFMGDMWANGYRTVNTEIAE